MKESVNRTLVELAVVNSSTGELFQITGTNEETCTYYSVKNITTRINAMDLFTIMEITCKSSKDISIINHLTEMVGKDNIIRIDNITELAKDFSISRVKLTTFLKLLADNKFTYKLDKGVYLVNPFIFVGRRVNSNKLREAAQAKWEKITKDET